MHSMFRVVAILTVTVSGGGDGPKLRHVVGTNHEIGVIGVCGGDCWCCCCAALMVACGGLVVASAAGLKVVVAATTPSCGVGGVRWGHALCTVVMKAVPHFDVPPLVPQAAPFVQSVQRWGSCSSWTTTPSWPCTS